MVPAKKLLSATQLQHAHNKPSDALEAPTVHNLKREFAVALYISNIDFIYYASYISGFANFQNKSRDYSKIIYSDDKNHFQYPLI